MSTKSDTDEIYRLVSFLGLGKRNPQTGQYEYEKARWQWNGREEKTTYVADALARFLKPRQAVIISTVEARNAHHERLEDALEGDGVSRICFQKIPKGSSSTEAWQQFDVIRREISECLKGPVALDITHGFRSQPFFAAAVIAFQRAVEGLEEETGADSGKGKGAPKRTPIRVFYGAFDAGKEKRSPSKARTVEEADPSEEDEIPEAPIWELTEFVTVLDWALALHLFLKTGRAEDAAQATRQLKEALKKEDWTGQPKQEALGELECFAEALDTFGRDFETIRTGDMLLKCDDGSASSAKRLFDAATCVIEAWKDEPYPIADLAGRVRRMVEPLADNLEHLACKDGHRAVAALARLYLNFGRYNEALITMSEGIVNRYARNENVAKPATCAFSGSGREKSESDARCDQLYKKVGNLRNDIAHAQYQKRHSGRDSDPKKAKPASQIIQQTKEVLEEFEAFEKKERASRALSKKQKKPPIFLNISNHPSDGWPEEQRQAALKLADEVHDLPFPCVPPDAGEQEIERLARGLVARIPEGTGHALVQGEFTLTCQLVRCLQARGITCWAATTARDVEERPDGTKVSRFRFVRLRRYPDLGLASDEEG
ncbi:MAG: hypothetical protein KatS3mg119_1931 [Rhodothalassiaceae bacterium]|nr:MAG: hypothetical protein KatS3mg119_1931 [Rhodothalassiaceae bacterium]